MMIKKKQLIIFTALFAPMVVWGMYNEAKIEELKKQAAEQGIAYTNLVFSEPLEVPDEYVELDENGEEFTVLIRINDELKEIHLTTDAVKNLMLNELHGAGCATVSIPAISNIRSMIPATTESTKVIGEISENKPLENIKCEAAALDEVMVANGPSPEIAPLIPSKPLTSVDYAEAFLKLLLGDATSPDVPNISPVVLYSIVESVLLHPGIGPFEEATTTSAEASSAGPLSESHAATLVVNNVAPLNEESDAHANAVGVDTQFSPAHGVSSSISHSDVSLTTSLAPNSIKVTDLQKLASSSAADGMGIAGIDKVVSAVNTGNVEVGGLTRLGEQEKAQLLSEILKKMDPDLAERSFTPEDLARIKKRLEELRKNK